MNSIRRVLIVQPYGLGDALFTTPLLRALRTLPSVESVDLLLGSRTEAIFRNNPHAGQIFTLDKDRWHSLGRRELLREIFFWWKKLRGRYDLLIDLSLQRETAFYSGVFLGIPRRIGFNFKHRGTFLTQSISLPRGFEGRSVVEFYAELGRLVGLEIEEPFLEFYVSEEDRQRAWEIHRPADESYLAVAPGGGESWGKDAHFKRWPACYFAQALLEFRKRVNFGSVVILGSKGERSLGEAMEQTLASDSGNPPDFKVINLCGEVSLGVAAAILEGARLLLANDGGLVHLAHALHVPLVALFGPADPKVYGPFPAYPRAVPVMRRDLPCRPCYSNFRYNSACVDRECLTELPPEAVKVFLDRKNFWKNCVNGR
ncbi:MAG: glycosyltransferase family 9 protein [Candidatus Omnitrophica bacterium]|nr:glycosyltransferase family 9 protein [Candidatus Omnitrophota bacterium]